MSMCYCSLFNACNTFYLAKVINKIQSAKLFVAKLSGFPQVTVKRRRKAAPHAEAQPFLLFTFFLFLLHLVNDGLKSLGVVHGEVGKHLTVDLDAGL